MDSTLNNFNEASVKQAHQVLKNKGTPKFNYKNIVQKTWHLNNSKHINPANGFWFHVFLLTFLSVTEAFHPALLLDIHFIESANKEKCKLKWHSENTGKTKSIFIGLINVNKKLLNETKYHLSHHQQARTSSSPRCLEMGIPPPLLPWGKKQEICQPPANNITLNFLLPNTCMPLRMMD